MARKRACFASSVCCTDDFSDLPASAQALYFRLGFHADADGAVDGVRGIVRGGGFSDGDMQALFEAGLLLDCGGVPVIAHWWTNNTKNIRDYRPGDHLHDMESLFFLGEDRVYHPIQGKTEGSTSDSPCASSVKGKEGKKKEFNGSETNFIKAKTKEFEEARESLSECAFLPCPVCLVEFPAFGEPDGSMHSYCDTHGDFFANADGEYLQ